MKNFVDNFIVESDQDLFDLSIKTENNIKEEVAKQSFKFIKNNERLYARQSKRSEDSTNVKTLISINNDSRKSEKNISQETNKINPIRENDSLNKNEFDNIEEECDSDLFNECMTKDCLTLKAGQTSKRPIQNNNQRKFHQEKSTKKLIKKSSNCFQKASSPDKVLNHLIKISMKKLMLKCQTSAKSLGLQVNSRPSNNHFSKHNKSMKSNNDSDMIHQNEKVHSDIQDIKTLNNSNDFDYQKSGRESISLYNLLNQTPFQLNLQRTENNQLAKMVSNFGYTSPTDEEIKMLDYSKIEEQNQIFTYFDHNRIYKKFNKDDHNMIKDNQENKIKFIEEYRKYCTKKTLDYLDLNNLLKKMSFISSTCTVEEEQELCKKLWEILDGNSMKVISSNNLLIMLMIISKFLNNLNEVLEYSSDLCFLNRQE